ncbi:hypothetical protein Trydic_g13393 [Trypoxylus dichotomus]
MLKAVIVLLFIFRNVADGQDDDDDDDSIRPPQPEDIFIGWMITEGGKFKAIKISGGVAVTEEDVQNATHKKYCDHENCKASSNITKVNEELGVAYVKVLFGPHQTSELIDHLYKREPSWSKKCRVYSYDNGEGIKVRVTRDGEIICEGCEHMDALFCRHLFVGALVENENETLEILPYYTMLRFAETIIDEDQIMKEYLASYNIPLNTTQIIQRKSNSPSALSLHLRLFILELLIVLGRRFTSTVGLLCWV